jgi:type IV fimbrial biogenesis protein FimT
MKKQLGLTLMELLISVSLIAILMGVAVPSFRPFFAKRAATAGADTLVMDYRFARSEALRRTNSVTICRSINSLSCAVAGSWHDGWIVFVDSNSNQTVDAGEDILRVQGFVTGVTSIHKGDAATTRSSTTFRPTGLAVASSESLFVTADAAVPGGTRLICVSQQGRASLRNVGVAAC